MEPTDQQLILACRRGDQAAWEMIVKRYQRLIFTIPRRAGLDRDQTADVFQEVMTTLFEKLDVIEQPEKLHSWLVTTARRKTWRVVVESRTHRHRLGETEDDEAELAALSDEAPLAEEVLLRLEEQHQVRTAVALLDERCRKLIELLFYNAGPMPYSEVARALGTSEGSIGPTRARCLEKLLRLLRTQLG